MFAGDNSTKADLDATTNGTALRTADYIR